MFFYPFNAVDTNGQYRQGIDGKPICGLPEQYQQSLASFS
jgi:hypothetical protein